MPFKTESTAIVKSSQKQLQAWTAEMMTAMQQRWPQRELSPFESRAWFDLLKDLHSKYGTNRVTVAMQRCMTELQFYPVRDEITSRLPENTDGRRFADPDCKDCSGSGWRYLQEHELAFLGKHEQHVRRCHCLRDGLPPKDTPPCNCDLDGLLGMPCEHGNRSAWNAVRRLLNTYARKFAMEEQ